MTVEVMCVEDHCWRNKIRWEKHSENIFSGTIVEGIVGNTQNERKQRKYSLSQNCTELWYSIRIMMLDHFLSLCEHGTYFPKLFNLPKPKLYRIMILDQNTDSISFSFSKPKLYRIIPLDQKNDTRSFSFSVWTW